MDLLFVLFYFFFEDMKIYYFIFQNFKVIVNKGIWNFYII